MKTGPAKADLSAARKRLVELMQKLNFGRIEQHHIRDGNPILDPAPRIIREHKFGGDNGPRRELAAGDFQLKAQLVDLFRLLDRIGTGVIAVLNVKGGLPHHAELPG